MTKVPHQFQARPLVLSLLYHPTQRPKEQPSISENVCGRPSDLQWFLHLYAQNPRMDWNPRALPVYSTLVQESATGRRNEAQVWGFMDLFTGTHMQPTHPLLSGIAGEIIKDKGFSSQQSCMFCDYKTVKGSSDERVGWLHFFPVPTI